MYTPETIKPNLEVFIQIVNSVLPLLRGDSAKTVRDIMSLLSSVLTKDWFIEILCYLLNRFNKDETNPEQKV